MNGLALAELIQSTRMSMAFMRVYGSYRMWLLRERPENLASRIEVDDISVYYHCYGRGEPVILLHGGFMFLETWAGQIPALARSYRVIAVDSRGHGRTTLGTHPLTYRRLAEDTAALIERLRLGAVNLIGWSDGGCTALALAIDRPDLVRSMVLLGAPFSTENYGEEAKRKIDHMLQPRSLSLFGLQMMRRVLTPEPEKFGEFACRMRKMWTELPDFSVEELGGIQAPTLVIGCDRDEFFSLAPDPLQLFKDTAAAVPGARLEVIRGGTHTVHMERPREVNGFILSFLQGAR